MSASGTHQRSGPGRARRCQRHEKSGESHRDHGDCDGGNLEQLQIVLFECLGEVAREQPTILDAIAVVCGLADIDPALLIDRGNEVNARKRQSQSGCDGGAQNRRPGPPDQSRGQGHPGHEIAGENAERDVGEPGACQHDGERGGGPVESAPPNGCCRIAIAQNEEKEERNPEAAGELSEGCSLVGGVEGVPGEKRRASGEGCRSIRQRLASQHAGSEAGSCQDEKRQRNRRQPPVQHGSQRGPQHPGERRIEDEPRLACAEVGARRPARIEDAFTPTVQRVEPRDEMEIEVVTAGVAAEYLRGNGDERGDQNDGGPDERAPGWEDTSPGGLA